MFSPVGGRAIGNALNYIKNTHDPRFL